MRCWYGRANKVLISFGNIQDCASSGYIQPSVEHNLVSISQHRPGDHREVSYL